MNYKSWALCISLLTAAATAHAAPIGLPIPPSVLREVAGEKPAPVSQAKKDEVKIAALKTKALSDDPTASLAALNELKAMGDVAKSTLVNTLRTLLNRDGSAVAAAVTRIGSGAEAADFEKQIETLRAAARDNIAKLDKAQPEYTKKAHEYYDQLLPMTAKMNQAWAIRLTIVESMSRRPELLALWRDVAPATDKSFGAEAEDKLKASARQAVGDVLDKAAGIDWNKPPADEALRPLWHYGLSRRIEAWNNRRAEKFMDANELKNLAMVNAYREAIGLLPYEADARLVQSARRHSKEMVDKNYFSHESPTPSEAEFGTRCKNAGYDQPAGENIAYGGKGGEGTFHMWFDSPGHHQNMAGGGTAIGVGRWHDHYTQNFGRGPRVMQMSDEDQAKVKIEGPVIAPDAGAKKKA